MYCEQNLGMPGMEWGKVHLADHLKGRQGDNIEKKVLR